LSTLAAHPASVARSAPPASVAERARVGSEENLLVLSDVHLGSDLNDLAPAVQRSRTVDADLVRLLVHYAGTRAANGRRWTLVLAGDFVDFIGITLHPASLGATDAALETQPDAEEREHGLGNAADHARLKLRRVASRHADVFDALADFVDAGHALATVHGNHDIEFHWELVQREMRAQLLAHATRDGRATDAAAFEARVTFHPWFFLVDGVAYVEHGHQYDTYCATENVIMPLSPLDPRRVARGFSDVMIRYVVRPTRGLREHGHEHMGMLDYASFAVRLGFRGMCSLGVRFVRAIFELFRLRRTHFIEAATALRAEHERRITLLAEATRIGKSKLEALLALQAPPVTRSIAGILGSLILDRMALGLLAIMMIVGAGIFGAWHGHGWWFLASILVAWALAHRHLARRRTIDPGESLAMRSSELARLFAVPFVVMGHTHVPMHRAAGGDSTYVNVGSWAEEEPEGDDPSTHYRAARTHLVITPSPSGPVASLLTWDPREGPRSYAPAHERRA
jgi:UDP-2,3-diacylglucosamine pyrophosphatase LpxH